MEKPKVSKNSKVSDTDYLEKTVKEIDIDLIKLDYLYTYVYGLQNRIRYLLSSKLRKTAKVRFFQLDFINQILTLAKHLNAENKAYLLLGAIQYVQGRWGKFPNSGPLYELTLKRDDLEHVLGSYAKEINLEKLLSNPKLIRETADMKFLEFFGKHPELKFITLR